MDKTIEAKFDAVDAALDELYFVLGRKGRKADTQTWKEYRALRAHLVQVRNHLATVRAIADHLAGGH